MREKSIIIQEAALLAWRSQKSRVQPICNIRFQKTLSSFLQASGNTHKDTHTRTDGRADRQMDAHMCIFQLKVSRTLPSNPRHNVNNN